MPKVQNYEISAENSQHVQADYFINGEMMRKNWSIQRFGHLSLCPQFFQWKSKNKIWQYQRSELFSSISSIFTFLSCVSLNWKIIIIMIQLKKDVHYRYEYSTILTRLTTKYKQIKWIRIFFRGKKLELWHK